jgi:outer membrane protein
MISTRRFAIAKLLRHARVLIPGLAAALPGAPALADDAPAGDAPVYGNTVRIGYYFVHYSASAADLSGPFTPPGLNLEIDNVNTLYFAYLRRLTAHLSVEVAAGLPPTTRTVGVGPASLGSVAFNGMELGTAKWFSPSALLEYVFMDEHSSLRPFLGAGVNYTHFYERNATAAGIAVDGGPTQTSLSDSFGPAGAAGMLYRITPHVTATASFSLARIKSDLVLDTSGIRRTTTIDFHPTAWVVAVGYSF